MLKFCPDCQKKYPEDTEFCAQDGTRLLILEESRDDPIIGRALDGRWVIQERIGEGGMGSVYLASQRSIDRKVAIKTLKPSLSTSSEFVDRFFREARVASTIAHPHCVMIHDFGQTEDGLLYLAMEYLEGAPLTDRLKAGDMTIKEIIEVSIQLSSALAAAHSHNIIHRDLKPDNIFMLSIQDGSTFIKVLDFGIAKVLDDEEKMTKTGQVFGTPEYMSPEQCRGDDLDGRSDLYSMGCILYEMLGGRPPFESKTPMAVLVSHVRETPAHIAQASDRQIPASLARICMRLLEKEADDRFADTHAVRQALEAELAAQSDTSKQTSVAAPGPPPAFGPTDSQPNPGTNPATPPPADHLSAPSARAQADQSLTGTSYPPKTKSKRPLIFVLVALAVLTSFAACSVGVWYAMSAGDDEEGVIFASLESESSEAQGEPDPGGSQVRDEEQGTAGAKPSEETDNPDETNKPNETDNAEETGDKASPRDEEAPVAEESPGDDTSGRPPKSRSEQGSPAAASAQENGSGAGSKPSTDDNSSPPKDDDQPDTRSAEVEPEVTPGSNEPEPDDDEKVVEDKTKPSTDPEPEIKTEPKPEPPKPSVFVRRTKLSATGAACIQPDVKAKLGRSQGRFERCYASSVDSNPSAEGTLIMDWNIDSSGKVISANLLVDRVGHAPLGQCVVSAIKSIRFAEPTGGRCYVRATYSFSQ